MVRSEPEDFAFFATGDSRVISMSECTEMEAMASNIYLGNDQESKKSSSRNFSWNFFPGFLAFSVCVYILHYYRLVDRSGKSIQSLMF